MGRNRELLHCYEPEGSMAYYRDTERVEAGKRVYKSIKHYTHTSLRQSTTQQERMNVWRATSVGFLKLPATWPSVSTFIIFSYYILQK